MDFKTIVPVLASVVGALLFSLFLKNVLEAPFLFATADKNDAVQLSDFYSKIGDNSNVRSLSQDITIISTDGIDRKRMAELVSIVDSMQPKVLGMDIMFLSKQEGDEQLIAAINASQRIVLPYGLTENKNSDNYSLKDSCYFYDKIANKRFGAVNLEGLSIKSTIRVFKPEFKMRNGTIRNFAVEIARLYSNRSFEKLKKRKDVTELINYHGVDFIEIPWENVLKGKDASLIKNKIVLLGTTASYADIHCTPVKAEMPGVYIQAYTVNTIIKERYVNQVCPIINYLIAVLFSLVFCSYVYYVRQNVKYIGRLLIRVCQLLFMILFLFTGTYLYLKTNTYVNFSLALSMIGSSLLMLDIVSGLYWLYIKFSHFSK